MRILKTLAGAAALASLAAAPLMAQASSASALSLRASTASSKDSKAGPDMIIPVVALVAVLGSVVLVTTDNGPTSP